MKVTIAILTKDEEKTIEEVIGAVRKYADEILVVDGHSKDKTREIAMKNKVKVVLDNKKGKGDGIRVAIKEAKHDIIVFVDADGSHEPKDILKLVKPIKENKADMVLASRIRGGSDDVHIDLYGFIRQTGSNITTCLINIRWKTDLTDLQNGFRAIRKDVAKSLRLTANDFDIEQEMVMKCLKKKYRIKEIASHEYARKAGKSKLPTSKAWRFALRFIIDFF